MQIRRGSPRVGALILGLIVMAVAPRSFAADIPPLPDQRQWDEAIERLSRDPDPKLAANKRVIMESQLGFAQAARYGHVREIVERYLSPDYVQHASFGGAGREGVIQMFEVAAKRSSASPPPPNMPSAIPKVLVAQGDYVGIIFDGPNASATIFKVENGKVAEHWAGAAAMSEKPAPPPP